MQKPTPRPLNTAASASPFWALSAVFVTLVFLQTVYVVEDFRGRTQIKGSQAALSKTLDQAETISKTAENVGHELLALSADKSHEADRIIAEFNIKLNSPPQASSNTPSQTSSTSTNSAK